MATRDTTDPTVCSDLNTSLVYSCPWPSKQDKNEPARAMGTERRGAALLHRTHWMEPCAPVSTTRALLRAGRSVHSLLPPPWELPRAPGSQSCRLWIPQTLYPSVSPVMVTSPWPLPHLSFHRGKSLYHGHLRPLKKIREGRRARPHVNGLPPTKPPAAPARRTLFSLGQTPQ